MLLQLCRVKNIIRVYVYVTYYNTTIMLKSSKIRYIGVSFLKKILFDNNKNVISRALKIHRVKNGLSQTQLAAKMQTLGVNIDQQMISKIEHNTRFVTDYELACFCRILGVSMEEMLSDFFQKYAVHNN